MRKYLIVNVGLFSRSHWMKCLAGDAFQQHFCRTLSRLGFQSTPWQIVYLGQIGGLVRVADDGYTETHVRFFDDGTIESEVEVGRRYVEHFLVQRECANQRLLATVETIEPELREPLAVRLRSRYGAAKLGQIRTHTSFARLALGATLVVSALALLNVVSVWIAFVTMLASWLLHVSFPKRVILSRASVPDSPCLR